MSALALATTFADVSRTLSSPLTFEIDGHVHWAVCDGERLGWIVKTTRPQPDMRWKWEADGTWGFSPTREKAIEAIESLVPAWREMRAEQKAEQAEHDAEPEPVKQARENLKQASINLAREQYRNVIRPDDLKSAERAFEAALAEFRARQVEAA